MQKKTLLLAVLAAAFVTCLSCTKPATDAEVRQAYLYYIEAPKTLTKALSSSKTPDVITETLSNDAGSYERKTVLKTAENRVQITSIFKDYHPQETATVTINGQLTLTGVANRFTIEGELNYKGTKPATLSFQKVLLEQKEEEGSSSFTPLDGYVVADKRQISTEELFTGILK